MELHGSARRLGAAVLTTALLGSGALVAPASADAPNVRSKRAAGWLAGQLSSKHLMYNGQYKFADIGLSLDTSIALRTLQAKPAAARGTIRYLRPAGRAVTDGYIGGTGRHSAGATGKLATAVELAGGDPKSYGGRNLVYRLNQLVVDDGAQQGRGVDQGPTDYSNTIGQTWVVRALSGAGGIYTADAVAFLLKQQCAAGFFRLTIEATTDPTSDFTCDDATAADNDPSVDATALSVLALVQARQQGQSGVSAAIRAAATWLQQHQRGNGSFGDQGVRNANSTGLAAAALSAAGRDVAARRSAQWLTGLQVTRSVAAKHPKLKGEVGAIAYSADALQQGYREGITRESRDQWRRATSQAVLGIALAGP